MPSATQSSTGMVQVQEASAATAAAASSSSSKSQGSNLSFVPRDARLIALILDSMGIQDVQPPVLMMLLEFAHRYLHEVLQDSLVYADHANSSKTTNAGVSTLTLDDIQLAIQSRVNHSFTGPPSKEILLSLASSLNSVPLPPILDRYGLKLPPAQHCLTNVNFSLVPNPPPEDSSDEEDAPGEDDDDDADGADGGPGGKSGTGGEDVDEEDAAVQDDRGDHTRGTNGDTSMAEAEQPRGTKRSLDEDEEYD